MSTATLADPASVQARLEEIDGRLAVLANELEQAALDWFRAKRARERQHAEAFMSHEGSVAERTAAAALATSGVGVEEEGAWEGKRAVFRALESRAQIGMSILKAQTRPGA